MNSHVHNDEIGCLIVNLSGRETLQVSVEKGGVSCIVASFYLNWLSFKSCVSFRNITVDNKEKKTL